MANFNAPANIAETVISKVGVSKCKLSFWSVIILGILAGAFIAFGAQLATRMGAMITFDKGISTLVFGSVFSVGLMLVVIAGAELFTGNNLMFMSVLAGEAKFGQMLGKWVIVFIANFIGSILIAWFRAIMCNWLVCLAVWLALASHDIVGKIFGIFFPIMAFVASGFEHSIANMYFIPIGMFVDTTGSITWGGFFSNLIPVTIGNIIGGAGFVATLYWLVFRKCTVK
jgi:formate/nitrite transporter FocA (FNT family)